MSSDARPVLSVVTPVKNGMAYLPRCLESVSRLAAALPGRVEHVIADGGSVDGSAELAQRALTDPDSPVAVVLTGPDSGQSEAINRGVERSRGRFVAWLNADDVYRSEAMVRLLGSLETTDADVVVARCRFVDLEGRERFRPRPPEPITAESMLRLLTSWFAGRSLVQPEVFIRRDAWDAAGGLDQSNHYSMDHDLWVRLAVSGMRFESIDRLVAEQLVHEGQKTADNEAVVRSMLIHAQRTMVQKPDVYRHAEAEIGCIRQRLARLGQWRALLTRSAPAGQRACGVIPQSGLGLSPLWIRGIRSGGVTASVDGADIPGVTPSARICGSIPPFGPSFDCVVAHAPTVRYGTQARSRLVRWLKPGGRLILLDEPMPAACVAAHTRLHASLPDWLTVGPGRSVLDDPLTDDLREALRVIGLGTQLDSIEPAPTLAISRQALPGDPRSISVALERVIGPSSLREHVCLRVP